MLKVIQSHRTPEELNQSLVSCDIGEGFFLPRANENQKPEGVELLCEKFNRKLASRFKRIEIDSLGGEELVEFAQGDYEIMGGEVYLKGVFFNVLSDSCGGRIDTVRAQLREQIYECAIEVVDSFELDWQGDDVRYKGKRKNSYLHQFYESDVLKRHFLDIYSLFELGLKKEELGVSLGAKSQQFEINIKGQLLSWRSFVVRCARLFFPRCSSGERQKLLLESLRLMKVWSDQFEQPSLAQVNRIKDEVRVERLLKARIRTDWKDLFNNFRMKGAFMSGDTEVEVPFTGEFISFGQYLDQVYSMMFGKRCGHEEKERIEIAFNSLKIWNEQGVPLDDAKALYMKKRLKKFWDSQRQKTSEKKVQKKKERYDASFSGVIRNHTLELYDLFHSKIINNGGKVDAGVANRDVDLEYKGHNISWRAFLHHAGKEFFENKEDYLKEGLVLLVLKSWQENKRQPTKAQLEFIKARYNKKCEAKKLVSVEDVQSNFYAVYSLFCDQFAKEGQLMSTSNKARAVKIVFRGQVLTWDKCIDAMGSELFPGLKVSERRNKKKVVVEYMKDVWQKEVEASVGDLAE